MKLNIYCDGGARGNPGPAAIGVYILNEYGKKLGKISKRIGMATNNEAEYQSVIAALDWANHFQQESKVTLAEINCYLDSQLTINQLNGIFKVEKPNLRHYIMTIRILESSLTGPVKYTYVPRQKNRQADQLVNDAINKKNEAI